MFTSLSIEGFRGLKTLRLAGLGRVNLLVGANNSGKTSVLEAVQMLASGGDVLALIAGLRRRDERSADPGEEQSNALFDARHLFYGRTLDGGAIRLGASTDTGRFVELLVEARRVNLGNEVEREQWRRGGLRWRRGGGASIRQMSLLADDELKPGDRAPRFLEVSAEGGLVSQLPLLHGGGLSGLIDEEQLIASAQASAPVHFVGTSSLTQVQLARLLDRAILVDEVPAAIAALATVESGITRLAAVDDGRNRRIVVGLQGVTEPVPLGNLGDGMSRMLALALSLVAARDGHLLVDEIDTGLHHSVMRKMWRLVFENAQRLNVCVYATTHSYDCVHALSAITDPEERADGQVALLRVERGFPDAIHFTERQISLLAEREVEPR